MKRRVIFLIINSLGAGGAERQLCELATHLDQNLFEIHVLVQYPPGYFNDGALWPILANATGVQLHSLKKKRGVLGYPALIVKLWMLARRFDADIIYGFLDATIPAWIVGRLHGARVVWGVRRTFADLSKLSRLSNGILRLRIFLARFVDLVIFNSEASAQNHRRMGMRPLRSAVIPNGFDTDRFCVDVAAGARQRMHWELSPNTAVVGLVGRFDPVKDHLTFLRAAVRIRAARPDARFVCVGAGSMARGAELRRIAGALGIADAVLWAGLSDDMPACYNAFSLLMLTSTDEGFPNAIGEAMACGVPCVTTKVGDAEILVGDTGQCSEVGDANALAQAAEQLLGEDSAAHESRRAACRTRIAVNFGLSQLAQRTADEMLRLF